MIALDDVKNTTSPLAHMQLIFVNRKAINSSKLPCAAMYLFLYLSRPGGLAPMSDGCYERCDSKEKGKVSDSIPVFGAN